MKVNKLDWLQIAEYLSISGAVIGSIAAVASQSVLYASVPLSLSLMLNLFSRHRTEEITRARLTVAVTQFDRKLSSIKTIVDERVEELRTDLAQLNEEAQKILQSQQLENLTASVLKLQQQVQALEQTVSRLDSQLEELTQQTQFPDTPEVQEVRLQRVEEQQVPPVYDAGVMPPFPPTAPTPTPTDPQDILRRYHW